MGFPTGNIHIFTGMDIDSSLNILRIQIPAVGEPGGEGEVIT